MTMTDLNKCEGKGGPPDLLTTCPSPETHNTGPLRVDRTETYDFLRALLGEVATVFPDPVFHGGGDEVQPGCWARSVFH